MDDKETMFYDTSRVVGRAITTEEYVQLCDMFNTLGWKILMKLKQEDAIKTLQSVASPSTEDAKRKDLIISYTLLLKDLSLQDALRLAITESGDPMSRDEVEPDQIIDLEISWLRKIFARMTKSA